MCETKQRRLEAANASGIQAFLTGLLGKNAQTYFIQHVSQVKSHIFECHSLKSGQIFMSFLFSRPFLLLSLFWYIIFCTEIITGIL